jgi:hypothetical protein
MNILQRLCVQHRQEPVQSPKGLRLRLTLASIVTAAVLMSSGLAPVVYAQPSASLAPITGPEQDCGAALPITDSIFAQPNIYRGFGRVQDLNSSSCIGLERNAVWYKVVPLSSGRLGFTLEPQNPNDDFDWAVYRIPAGRTWADIPSDSTGSLQVSCNFATSNGPTGPNGRGDKNRQDSDGSPFNALIPVNAGEAYFIVINTSVPAQGGYRLNFSSSSLGAGAVSVAQMFRAEATAPRLATFSAEQNSCGVFTLTATFSEYVRCASVQAADFVLTAPTGQTIAITGTASARCGAAVNNFDTTYTLTLAQPINESGAYTLAASGVTTLAGAAVQSSTSQTLSFPTLRPRITGEGVASGSSGAVALVCTGGTVVLDAGGGYVRYTWSSSATSSASLGDGRTFVARRTGTYFVTVQDKNGCVGRASVTVQNRTDGIVPVIQGFAYICNRGSAYIGVAAQYASYRWSTGDTTFAIFASQPGTYSITVRDFGGCEGTASVTVERRYDSTMPPAQLSGALQFCEGTSTTLETNRYMASYQWYFNGDSLRLPDAIPMADRYRLNVTKPGVYKVRISNNGCTFDSREVTVRSNALPATPTITRRGNVLTSTPSQTYQWFSASSSTVTAIAGANSRDFVVQRDGRYVVQVSDSNGCQAISAPIDILRAEGRAALRVGVVSANDFGRFVTIPVFLDSASNLEATGATGFTALLRMNAQLLQPADPRLRDSLFNGERFIRLLLPLRPTGPGGLLDTFRFQFIRSIAVVPVTSTVLALHAASTVPSNVGVTVTTATGTATVNRNLTFGGSGSEQGGDADVLGAISASVAAPNVETVPNPATDGSVAVKYILPQEDTVTVSLADAMGIPIKTLVTAKLTAAGAHSLMMNTNELKTGTYFVIVRTPQHVSTRQMTVLR